MGCKETRKAFASLSNTEANSPGSDERAALSSHLRDCQRCAAEYRLLTLERTVLNLTAAEAVTPDNDFFIGLRARIARGPEQFAPPSTGLDDFWTNALWATARQLIPAMAMLLLLIIGMTLMWSSKSSTSDPSLDAQYRVRGMTADDMLETIVAEERINGR